MCDRDSGEQRRGDRARDPRDDLACDSGGSQRKRFLAAAPEHKRIAALQSNHSMAAAGLANHQSIDRLLRDRRPARALSDKESPRPRRKLQRLRIDQRVVEHKIRSSQPLDRLERQKLGIAGAGANE